MVLAIEGEAGGDTEDGSLVGLGKENMERAATGALSCSSSEEVEETEGAIDAADDVIRPLEPPKED